MARIISSKDIRKVRLNKKEMLWVYCGLDVCNTFEIAGPMREIVDADPYFKHAYDLSLALYAPVMSIQTTGIKVNQERRAQHIEDLKQELFALSGRKRNEKTGKWYLADKSALFPAIAGALTGEPFAHTQPKMLAHAIYECLKIDKVYDRAKKTYTPSTSDDTLTELAKKYPHARPLIQLVQYIRKGFKDLEALENSFDPDGRIRFGISIAGTKTGRWSSKKNIFNRAGNGQNIAKRLRDIYEADEGYTMGYCDLKSAESYGVGYITGDENYIDTFHREDIHTLVAASAFNVPKDVDYVKKTEWKPGLKYRDGAKRCHVADTEVLTRKGWQSINHAANTAKQEIAIWGGDGQIKWEIPSNWFKQYVEETVYEFDGRTFNQCVTGDHEMLVWNNNKWNIRKAEDVYRKAYGRAPIHGILDCGTDYPYARLLAMAWADGALEKRYPNSVRVSVKKERKAERVRRLAKEAGLKLWESFSGDYWHFRVYGFHQKKLDASILSWSLKSRLDFLDELKYWDGCPKTGRIFNTDLEAMKLIQAVLHTCGYRAPIYNHGKPRNNEVQCYGMSPTNSALADYAEFKRSTRVYKGAVYCPTVSTSAFLVRRNDKVSVSRNCGHGTNYMLTHRSLARQMRIPEAQAFRFQVTYYGGECSVDYAVKHELFNIPHEIENDIVRFHGLFPKIREWPFNVQKTLEENNGYIITPMGRKRHFDADPQETGTLRKAVAYLPQSTIVDILNLGLWRVWYHCSGEGLQLLLQVHDAILIQVPTGTEEYFEQRIKELMVFPVTVNGRTMEIPIDVTWGQNFQEVS